MRKSLPESANLEWLRKAAKRRLREENAGGKAGNLAEAQRDLAREYGFPSWRALRAMFGPDPASTAGEDAVADFLRQVGYRKSEAVREALADRPELVNVVGPHPFWGGRVQALHVAVESKRASMVTLLLDAGAEIDGRNDGNDHWSPLMLSYWMTNAEVQELLKDRGARIGVCEALLAGDDDALDALLTGSEPPVPAARPDGILGLARTIHGLDRLLACGISPDETDRWGADAMESFSRLGPRGRPLVERLRAHGGRVGLAEYARLGDRGALEQHLNTDEVVPEEVFMAAVDFGHCDLAEWLIGLGANVNAAASNGSQGTSLHSACWNGDLPMVKLLTRHGADLRSRDPEHDNTPLGWAQVSRQVTNNRDCDDVIAFLVSLEHARN